jgi:hypothetical protein
MTDAVADTTATDRMIEDLNHTIDRQARDLKNLRQNAMMFADDERPEVVFQVLLHRLRRWHRARWLALIGLIWRHLFDTRR